jgi:phospholipase/carboxylesterase
MLAIACMNTIQITNYYEHKPASGIIRSAVILLHGLGADGRDLLGLAPEMARQLPDTVFISPDAPFPCDMAPYGHQWFSLQTWTPAAMLLGAKKVVPALHEFMQKILDQYSLPAAKLALAGFSQGTMMSLYTAPRFSGGQIAGILGYSGALLTDDAAPPIHKPPVHLIHGDMDTVVPVLAYHHARQSLEAGGFTVSGYTQPMLMHGIDARGIESGAAFLAGVLS